MPQRWVKVSWSWFSEVEHSKHCRNRCVYGGKRWTGQNKDWLKHGFKYTSNKFVAHFGSSLGKEVEREEVKTHCQHKKTDVSMKEHKCHKSMNRYRRSIKANYKASLLRSWWDNPTQCPLEQHSQLIWLVHVCGAVSLLASTQTDLKKVVHSCSFFLFLMFC